MRQVFKTAPFKKLRAPICFEYLYAEHKQVAKLVAACNTWRGPAVSVRGWPCPGKPSVVHMLYAAPPRTQLSCGLPRSGLQAQDLACGCFPNFGSGM